MYLESTTLIRRPLPEVWAFFEEMNLANWDRSVERVVLTSSVPVGVGFTFDMFGPSTSGEGFRSSYRVTEYRPGEYVWVDRTNSRLFSQARWVTRGRIGRQRDESQDRSRAHAAAGNRALVRNGRP